MQRGAAALFAYIFVCSGSSLLIGCPPAAFVRGPQFIAEPFAESPSFSRLYSHPRHEHATLPRVTNLMLVPVNVLGTASLNVLPLVAVVDAGKREGGTSTAWHFEMLGVCFPVHGGLPCGALSWDAGSIDPQPEKPESSAEPSN